jgi:hypothetical protein
MPATRTTRASPASITRSMYLPVSYRPDFTGNAIVRAPRTVRPAGQARKGHRHPAFISPRTVQASHHAGIQLLCTADAGRRSPHPDAGHQAASTGDRHIDVLVLKRPLTRLFCGADHSVGQAVGSAEKSLKILT